MDGVGTPIIGRPRPLPGHDTPNPANNTYTLNYEEPIKFSRVISVFRARMIAGSTSRPNVSMDSSDAARLRSSSH